MEKNNNGEKRWLTWVVRIILPALVAMMWLNLAGELDDLRDEIRALRVEVRTELAGQANTNQAQDVEITRIGTMVGVLWSQ